MAAGLTRRPYFLATIPLIICAVLVIPADYALSLALQDSDWLPGDLRRGIMLSEVFAHGIGIVYILLTIAVLDPRGWRNTARIAACAYVPGLLASIGKRLVARQRPSSADLEGSVEWPTIRTDQFENAFDYAIQSFPSGHTATAFGLAIGLSFAYPRGRWLFLVFAILAGLQRVVSGAHFPSDVLAGAAIACLVTPLLVRAKKKPVANG
jgi:membrane-associated phospholipid phosphatase